MSYMPPELAHEPMEITQRGSIICSYSRWMMGAILMNTVPAMTIKSASRGVPRMTSAPKRAMSYLLVILVAISTKQQERPKLKGHIEFLRPHATRSCSRANATLRRTTSSMVALMLTPVQCSVAPEVDQPGCKEPNEDRHFNVSGPTDPKERNRPRENENCFQVEDDES